MAFAKCARCSGIHDRIRSPVCLECQPDEDADYEKIRDAVSENPHLNAQQVAEATGVTVDCVLRMLDDGQITTDDLTIPIKCGRCGAPAISRTKRLCQRCLQELNQEVAAAVERLRKELRADREGLHPRWEIRPSSTYKVHEALARKRRFRPPPARQRVR